MIRALERRCVATLLFTQSGAAMPADIIEHVHLAALVPGNNQRLACTRRAVALRRRRNFANEIVPRVCHLRLMTKQQPLFREDLLSLHVENFRRDEITLRQGLRALRKRLSRLSECFDHPGSHLNYFSALSQAFDKRAVGTAGIATTSAA